MTLTGISSFRDGGSSETSSGNRIFARALDNNFLFSVAKHEGRGGAAGMCVSQSQDREACSSDKFAEFFRLSG